MNFSTKQLFAFPLALAGLFLACGASAQQHPRYRLVDLGTLGGPHSYSSPNGNGFQLLNNSGKVGFSADLSAPDPNQTFFCFNPDCFQTHAAYWKDGVITDLGTLPGNNNSAVGSINTRGWMTGQSESSTIDPVLGIPEFRAVLWKKDSPIIDLGTLPGGTESLGIYVNDSGQVIGFSTVGSSFDPLGFIGLPTHTFLWENGKMTDIGTLGGADAFPGSSCSGQPHNLIVGFSSISDAVNDATGLPTIDIFMWKDGQMSDLGNLGGTLSGFAVESEVCANHREQVVGSSTTPGDLAAHAFLWSDGVMKDLGTLGGDNSEAVWVNDAGVIAGSSDLPGISGSQTHDAVVWINGKIQDLGTVPGDPCSRGRGINARGQVVGGSSDCANFLHAFIWENDGPMQDLNTLIASGSGWQLTNAFNINDRGEILAKAAPLDFTPNDDADLGHLVLLVPCQSIDEGGCGGNAQTAATAKVAAKLGPSPMRPLNGAAWRAKLGQRYHLSVKR
jgi:probable HAF family extracellular repeat protein